MGAITLALVPSATPGDSRFALDALCVALTKLLDTAVDGINCASYQDLANELEKDRVDFAWMSPTLLMLTNERIQLHPLLSAVRYGRSDYASALFVDAAKPWYSLDDVIGRTVAWVDPASAAGYLFPRMHMAARGYDPATFFGKELFLRSHGDVVRAVVEGRADVGATYGECPEPGDPVIHAGFRDVMPKHEMRVIEWSPGIPSDMIVGHGLVAKPEHRVFADAIRTLGESDKGKRLLRNAFGADTFMATPKDALEPLQRLMARARRDGVVSQL